MKNLSLIELYKIKSRLLKEGFDSESILSDVIDAILVIENKINEDDFSSGMASGIPGETIGMNWASGGGFEGSGDISSPYNPSGGNRMVQKQKLEMGKNHGARTGKKSRVKKVDVKALRAALSKRKRFNADEEPRPKGERKVMNFNNFVKDEVTTIKKEGNNIVLETKSNDVKETIKDIFIDLEDNDFIINLERNNSSETRIILKKNVTNNSSFNSPFSQYTTYEFDEIKDKVYNLRDYYSQANITYKYRDITYKYRTASMNQRIREYDDLSEIPNVEQIVEFYIFITW